MAVAAEAKESWAMSDGSVVMITGGSSGFGRAAAVSFVAKGHRVAASARNLDSLRSLERDVAALPGSIFGVKLDVTVDQDRHRAVEQVVEHFGRLDVLVNNAGIAQFGALEATSTEMLRLVMETDFFGPAELMRLVLPIMRTQGQGRIINVTSGAAHGVSAYVGAYGSAKHALDALTATVDLEAMPFGVRAVSVVPGTYMTAMATNIITAPEMEPYGDKHAKLVQTLLGLYGDRTDLSTVSDAIVDAATAVDPEFIALAGPELAARTGPVVEAKREFHERLREDGHGHRG